MTVEDVAHRSRIPLAVLHQLEDNDYSQFPSPSYAKSFFAQYCDHLGLDSADLLDRFEAEDLIANLESHEFVQEHGVRVDAKPFRFKRPKRKKRKPAADPPQAPRRERNLERPPGLQPLMVFSTTALLITAAVLGFMKLSDSMSDDATAQEPEETLAPIGGLSTQTAAAPKFSNVPRALPVTSEDNLVAGDPRTSRTEPLNATPSTQSDAPIEFPLDNPPPRAIIIEE